jgi:hypothetical protein
MLLLHVCRWVDVADDIFRREERLKFQPTEIVLSDARSVKMAETCSTYENDNTYK